MLRRNINGGYPLMKHTIAAILAVFMLALPAQALTTGWASFYKSGRLTANGEHFKPMGLTAAHRKLPFGTMLKVTNLRNGKSVIVRVNDRGPFIRGRILDLSLGAAKVIGLNRSGVAKISFVVVN
jgi:rare lipoprotein A